MPRCMMHGVRGYKKRKYWDCQTNHQNVMKTRSGLLINTRPTTRQLSATRSSSNTSTNVSTGTNQNPSENSRPKPKNPFCVQSMSNISFVTRVSLLNLGAAVDLGVEYVPETRLSQNQHDNTEATPIQKASGKKWDKENSNNNSNNDSDKPIDLKVHKKEFENSECCEETNETQEEQQCEEEEKQGEVQNVKSKSRLAARHPVLLRYISRDEAAEAAASLLSLAAGNASPHLPSSSTTTKPSSTSINISSSTSFSSAFSIPSSIGCFPTSAPLVAASNTYEYLHAENPGKSDPVSLFSYNNLNANPMLKPRDTTDAESIVSDNTSIDQSTNDDDSSSITSQSSSDETFIQRVSKVDETFLKDLTCFQLESHAYAYDASGNQIHRCTVCERVFTVFSAFKMHVNTHVRPKNRCGLCGKIFSRSWLLKGHMRTHTGEKPYTCKYSSCNRKFADKSNLRSHLLIHTTKDKSFVCSKCKRAFAQKRYLHKHELEVCKI